MRPDRGYVTLLEHRARAHEVVEARVQADERVAEALELDRGDLLVVVAREEAQVGAAQLEGRDLGGDEVVDVGQQPGLRRDGRRLRAEDRRELGFGDAAGLLALGNARVIECSRRAAGRGDQHPQRGGPRRDHGSLSSAAARAAASAGCMNIAIL
jgi:hypothetical protein